MNDLLIPEGHIPPFADVKTAAALLGLPELWLKEQVFDGAVSSLLAGKTIRVHLGQLEDEVVRLCIPRKHDKRPLKNENLAKWKKQRAEEMGDADEDGVGSD